MAGMDFREATAGMAEPEERAGLVAALQHLGPAGSTVMEAMQVTAEPEELVQRELMERFYLVMAEPAESAEQEGAEA